LTDVPATKHQGPDGLSRCPVDENDSAISEEELEPDEPGHFITGPRSLEEYEDWTQLHPLASRLRISRIKREAYEDAVEFRQNSTVFFLKPQENSIRSGGFVALSHKVHFSRNSKTSFQHSEIKEHPHKIKNSDGKDCWERIENYLEHLKIPLGIKNTRSFIQTTKHYFLYQGTLWRRPKNGQLPQKVIKNPDDRACLCKAAHDNSGHHGCDLTFKKLSDRFFWPNMLSYVAWYCWTCHECQQRSTTHPKITLSLTYVNTILHKFNMDTVHMLVSNGFKYIVDLQDNLSGWLEAKMLCKATSKNVTKFLFKDIMCQFGCVLQITMDNGVEFDGLVQAMVDEYNVPIACAAPYHLEANGMIECRHRTWINSLFVASKGNPSQWSKYFYSCMWAD
jgi:Integrase zinc binding domain